MQASNNATIPASKFVEKAEVSHSTAHMPITIAPNQAPNTANVDVSMILQQNTSQFQLSAKSSLRHNEQRASTSNQSRSHFLQLTWEHGSSTGLLKLSQHILQVSSSFSEASNSETSCMLARSSPRAGSFRSPSCLGNACRKTTIERRSSAIMMEAWSVGIL
jgi:hypothetical protein